MKRAINLMVVLVLLFGVAACGGETATTPTTAPAATQATGGDPTQAPAATGEELYIFLPKSLDNPYWDACRKGMEDNAKKLGVKAEFIGPDTADAAKQVALFEAVIARKPSGIAVSPNDPETVKESINKAIAQGIPVIAWDADAPGSDRIAYVGTDNVAAGATAGEELAKLIGQKGKVAILTGSLTALNANQRIEGFKEAIAKYPEIQIVATEPTEDSISTALSKAETIMQANPDLAAFYGVTGSGVPGAGGAVKQAGKAGQVKVVGFDVVEQGIALMREDVVQVLISQRPYGMTVQAMDLLRELKDGKKPASDNIDTGVEVVYKDTLEEFLKTDH